MYETLLLDLSPDFSQRTKDRIRTTHGDVLHNWSGRSNLIREEKEGVKTRDSFSETTVGGGGLYHLDPVDKQYSRTYGDIVKNLSFQIN